jgi:hypothetical protein
VAANAYEDVLRAMCSSLVQAAKAKARGNRSVRTWKAITYLIAGKLDLKLPT